MAIADVVTGGFGSFSSVNYIPTRGFDIGAYVAPTDYRGWVYARSRVVNSVALTDVRLASCSLRSHLPTNVEGT